MQGIKNFKRIVVGTDFSRPAQKAVARAAMIAAEHKAQLEIVHAIPQVSRSILKSIGLENERELGHRPEVMEALDETLALAKTLCNSAKVKTVTGAPAAALEKEAVTSAADLIVVGARGERSIKDAVIGTTAERVIERSNRDVLIVREGKKARYKTILVCISFAPTSCDVMMSAATIMPEARLQVVHAYLPPFELKLISHGIPHEAISAHRNATKREAAELMKDLLTKCPYLVSREPSVTLRRGNPSQVILTEAARVHADLVVVGKNRSFIEKFFLGSVTKHIVRSASADILVSSFFRK